MTIEKFIKCRVVSTPDHFAEKLRNREVKSEYFLSHSLCLELYMTEFVGKLILSVCREERQLDERWG